MQTRAEATISGLDTGAVAQVLEEAPVSIGVLYGSYARGEQRTQSDIDVAVSFADSLSSLERTRTRLSLITRLSDALGTDRIDVVPLDEAPPSLVTEILADGVLIVGSETAIEEYVENTDTDIHPEARRTAFDDVLSDLEQVV